MEELNLNELVKIEQLPAIFEQLEIIGKYVDEALIGIDELECTEDNKQEVKKKRTEINNLTKLMEEKRKDIKSKILEPYELFNQKYEETIKDKLANANISLTVKINDIEKKQIDEKTKEVFDFYNEQVESYGIIDFVEFHDIGLKINLSSSVKSLKEQIMEHCEKVLKDIKLINLEEFKDEILVEYKLCKDYIVAKTKVLDRHLQLEELAKKQQEQELIKEQEEKIIEQVDEIIVPVEIDEELITLSFTVTGTREQLKELKQFMIEREIEYK